MMDMQNEAAAALGARPAGAPPAGPQNNGQPQPGGDGGSLAQFAQAYARCEQTKQCTPQDRAILEAGLPKLIQMGQMVQKILQASAGGGQQQPAPGAQPQPGAA